jgi:uncharacterized protein YjcR
MNYEKQIRIQTAAFLFTRGKSAEEIGELVGRSPRQVIRWSKLQQWEQVLELLDYQGDRSFRTKPTRAYNEEQVAYCHEVYTQIIREGTPPRNAARLTSERTGLPVARIREWSRRFGWREMD